MKKKVSKKWHMAGTEGTGEYVVIAATRRGRIGVRVLQGFGQGHVRIRLEPSKRAPLAQMAKAFPVGWKQPGNDGQNRFSRVVGRRQLGLVEDAFVALGTTGLTRPLKAEVNPTLPKWAKNLASKFVQMPT